MNNRNIFIINAIGVFLQGKNLSGYDTITFNYHDSEANSDLITSVVVSNHSDPHTYTMTYNEDGEVVTIVES